MCGRQIERRDTIADKTMNDHLVKRNIFSPRPITAAANRYRHNVTAVQNISHIRPFQHHGLAGFRDRLQTVSNKRRSFLTIRFLTLVIIRKGSVSQVANGKAGFIITGNLLQHRFHQGRQPPDRYQITFLILRQPCAHILLVQHFSCIPGWRNPFSSIKRQKTDVQIKLIILTKRFQFFF